MNKAERIATELKNNYGVPLKNFQKYPFVKDWQNRVWSEFTDEEKRDTTGYGVNCGRAGLVVIDLDRHSTEKDGIETWEKLVADEDNPDTLVVSTANGGIHRYYKQNPDTQPLKIRNSAEKALGAGIDVRAQGGQVVGPGSQVWKDADDHSKGKGSYEVIEANDIAELPDWLYKKLSEKVEHSESLNTANSANILSSLPFDESGDYKRWNSKEWLERILNDVLGLAGTSGNRNETILKAVGHAMFRGVSEDLARREFENVAIQIGLPVKEARKVVDNGIEYGRDRWLQMVAYDAMPLQPLRERKIKEVQTGDNDALENLLERKWIDLPPAKSIEWSHKPTAHRLAQATNDVSYVADIKKFYKADDAGYWSVDNNEGGSLTNTLEEWANEFIVRKNEASEKLKKLEKSDGDAGEIKKLRDEMKANDFQARQLLDNGFFKNVLTMYMMNTGVDAKEFDSSKTTGKLVGFSNGVLDTTTWEFMPIDAELKMVSNTGLKYDPNADHPKLEKLLEALPDEESRHWLSVYCGASLLGMKTTQFLVSLTGGGANGKSSFINALRASVGSYGNSLSMDFLTSTSTSHAYSRIENKRVGFISETADSQATSRAKVNIGIFKEVTGEHEVVAEEKYVPKHTIENNISIICAFNKPPKFNTQEKAVWRRSVAIPFPFTFSRDGDGIYKEGDPEIEDIALEDESFATAFLNRFLLPGLKEYVENPSWLKDSKNIPQVAKDETAEWKYNDEPLNEFVDEYFVLEEGEPKTAIAMKDVFYLFEEWSKANNTLVNMSSRGFHDKLRAIKGYGNVKQGGVKNLIKERPEETLNRPLKPIKHNDRYYYGFRLRTPADDIEDEVSNFQVADDASGLDTPDTTFEVEEMPEVETCVVTSEIDDFELDLDELEDIDLDEVEAPADWDDGDKVVRNRDVVGNLQPEPVMNEVSIKPVVRKPRTIDEVDYESEDWINAVDSILAEHFE